MTQATLHYIHDPLCGWCYAVQPLISAAMERLDGRIALQLHGGGLFPEPSVLDESLARHIAQADQRIAQYSGQPFGKPYLEGLLAERQRAGQVNAIDEGQTWHLCLSPAAVDALPDTRN